MAGFVHSEVQARLLAPFAQVKNPSLRPPQLQLGFRVAIDQWDEARVAGTWVCFSLAIGKWCNTKIAISCFVLPQYL